MISNSKNLVKIVSRLAALSCTSRRWNLSDGIFARFRCLRTADRVVGAGARARAAHGGGGKITWPYVTAWSILSAQSMRRVTSLKRSPPPDVDKSESTTRSDSTNSKSLTLRILELSQKHLGAARQAASSHWIQVLGMTLRSTPEVGHIPDDGEKTLSTVIAHRRTPALNPGEDQIIADKRE